MPTPRACGALATGRAAARSRKNRRAHPTAHSGGSFMSAVARRGALPAEDPVVQILLHGAFTSRFNGIRPLYAGRSEKMHEQGS